MTPADLHSLPTAKLLPLFDSLKSGAAPLGRYDGFAWSPNYPTFAALATKFWQGKTFTADFTVTNHVLGLSVVRGTLFKRGALGLWFIKYPQLGLTDELRWADGYYLGRMPWRAGWIWFTLTQVPRG